MRRRRMARLWMEALPSVQAFVASAIPKFHDAEDVVQETAEDVAEKFDRYDESRPFVAWAIGIARIRVAMYYRQAGRERLIFSNDALSAAQIAEQIGSTAKSIRVTLTRIRDRLARCIKSKLSGGSS